MNKDVRATTVQNAYRNFEPGKVLDVDSLFYIDPLDHNASHIKFQLVLSDSASPIKWFFMGHRGCGKSTLLKRVIASDDVNDKYFTVIFNIPDVVDMSEINHQDIIFAMCTKVIEVASEKDLVQEDIRRKFIDWSASISEEISKEETTDAKANLGTGIGFAKFMVNLRAKYSSKVMLRRKFEPQIVDLIEIFNLVCENIKDVTNKPVLVVIDDIDKVTPEAAKKIFGENISLMRMPNCFCVYTVPVSLMHADEWHGLMDHYWYLPNIKLYGKDDRDKKNLEGYNKMKEFFDKRASTDIIDEDALDECIKYGGGVFRQTCRIIQRSLMFCITRGGKKIILSDVVSSVNEYANGIVPNLTDDDVKKA